MKLNSFVSRKKILIAGVDESGCGSLVGSVVAVSVILNPSIMHTSLISQVVDSKTLNIKQRLNLYSDLQKYLIACGIGFSDVIEIDCLNILQARLLAMKRAVYDLSVIPDLVLIDGTYAPTLKNISCQCFVKGDAKIVMISAASIMAKVIRDQYMLMLDTQYPKYGFAQNKGYPTKFHLKQLKLYGPTLYHRRSFNPIRYMI